MNDFNNSPAGTSFDSALANVQTSWGTARTAAPAQQPQSDTLDQRTLKAFEDSATKYNVPVDVLMAMAEKDSGFDATARSRGPGEKTRGIIKMSDGDLQKAGSANPYLPEQNIDYAAAKLRGLMDSGNLSVPDAVKAFSAGSADPSQWSPGASEYAADVLGRTKRLKDTYYPPQPEPQAAAAPEPEQKPDGSLAQDAYFQTAGALNKGLGQAVRGVGEAVATLGDYTTTPLLHKIFGGEGKTPNALDGAAGALEGLGEKGQSFVSDDTKKAIEGSSPGGDLFKPSTWTLGKNPSLKGYTALGLDLFGGMLPILAADAAGGPAAALTVGGVQGGGAAAQQARDTINKMAETPADPSQPDGPKQIEKESAYYQQLIADGKTPAQALNITRGAAERFAFTFNAPISAVGGAVVGKALHGDAVGKTIASRVLSNMGIPAAEMGVQNPAASMATKAGINAGAGTNQDVTEGTFGDFLTGVVSGALPGAVGAARGEAARRGQAEVNPPADQLHPGATDQAGPAQEAAQQQPQSGQQSAAPDQPTTPPRGPLSAALDAGAPHVSPLADIVGKRVVLTDRTGQIAGHVIGQDAEGVLFKGDDGSEQLVSHAEIANGQTRLVGAPDAPVQAERAPLPPAESGQTSEGAKEAVASHEEAIGEKQTELPLTDQAQQRVEQPATPTSDQPAAPAQAAMARVADPDALIAKHFGEDAGPIGDAVRPFLTGETGPEAARNALRQAATDLTAEYGGSHADQAELANALLRSFEHMHNEAESGSAPPQEAKAAPDIQPTPAEAPRALADMSDPELRQRLKAVAAMAKVNGQNADLVKARREVEAEINRRADAAPVETARRPWPSTTKADAEPAGRASVASVASPISGLDAADLREHLTRGSDGPLIAKMLDAGKVTLHDDATTLPGGPAPKEAVQGVTMPDGSIHLVSRHLTPETARGVLLHEAFHAGAEPLVGSRGWRRLMERVQSSVDGAMERERSGATHPAGDFWRAALGRASEAGVPAKHLAEEVAAYAVERHDSAPAGLREAIGNFTGQLKAWALKRFGRQFGDVTQGQLHALARAALRSWKDEPTINATEGGPRYSMAAEDESATAGDGKSLYDKAKDRASDFLTDAMGKNEKFNLLKLVPVRPLFLELAKGMPSAKHYIDTKQAMDAMRHHLNAEDGKVLDKWSKWVREGLGKKNREENKRLMDLMHESTLAQVDPSKDFESHWTKDDAEALKNAKPSSDEHERLSKAKAEDDERRADHEDMKQRFDKLSPAAKEIYNEVRDAYEKRADDTEKEVVANIQRALDAMQRKAKDDYGVELSDVEAKGLTGKERQDAIDAATHKLDMMQTRVRRNRAARVKRLREQFESNRLKGPYFPLQRFGRYTVTVRDTEGRVVNFSRFESAAKQRAFADDMARNKDYRVDRGALESHDGSTIKPDSKFVADVDSILEGANAPSELRDQVWQRFLDTLSDMSSRKHRIHRKGRAGYNEDALRAFAFNAFHSAHQLSRLRYGLELQEHIDQARQQVRETADPVRSQAVFNEMLNAHNFAMNPKMNPASQWAKSLSFLWTMGWNLSSALVVLHDPIQRGIPNLAFDAKTGSVGVKKASKELANAAIDVMRGKGFVDNSSGLTRDERDAMEKARELGVIESTNAHDLAGVSETGVNYNPWKHALMKTSSIPLHHAERINREVTFLAAYRIASEKGMAPAEAVKNAADLTWMSQFDTQSSSKPAFMRNDMGSVLFALRNFHANILYRFFKDFHESINGMEPAEKKAATGRLIASMAITAGMAGVRGAYFYSYILPIAAAAMAAAGLRDKDKDPEEQLRKTVLDATGDTMIGRAVGGMMMDGIPGYFTGTALSQRIGVPDIGMRSPEREMNPEQTWQYWMEQLGGPSLSAAKNMWTGGNKAAQGEVWRGLEQMLPAAFGNAMRAARFAKEGVRDKDGNPIVESVAPQDVAKKFVGFQPAEIADRQARNTFQRNEQERIHHEKSDALRGAARARAAGDSEAEAKARQKVETFNDRFPEARITPKSIRAEMKRFRSRSDRMEYGTDLDPRLSDRIGEETAPSIYSRE